MACKNIKYVAHTAHTYITRLHANKNDWRVVTKNQISCLHWYFEYWVERLGQLGLFVIGLILVLLSYATLIAWPSQQSLSQQVTKQNLHLDMLKQSNKINIKKADNQQKGILERLESRKWPVVAQLLQSGLVVHQASYAKEIVVTGKLQRLNLELVLTGGYPALRQALTTLRSDSLLRLEFLQLERSGPETSMTHIRLRFSTLGML